MQVRLGLYVVNSILVGLLHHKREKSLLLLRECPCIFCVILGAKNIMLQVKNSKN